MLAAFQLACLTTKYNKVLSNLIMKTLTMSTSLNGRHMEVWHPNMLPLFKLPH